MSTPVRRVSTALRSSIRRKPHKEGLAIPCDSRILTSVSIQGLDRTTLKRALTKRNIAFQERRGEITLTLTGRAVTITKDSVTAQGSRYDRADDTAMLTTVADDIKVMAAMQSVDESAEANGWDVQWSFNELGQPTFELEREEF